MEKVTKLMETGMSQEEAIKKVSGNTPAEAAEKAIDVADKAVKVAGGRRGGAYDPEREARVRWYMANGMSEKDARSETAVDYGDQPLSRQDMKDTARAAAGLAALAGTTYVAHKYVLPKVDAFTKKHLGSGRYGPPASEAALRKFVGGARTKAKKTLVGVLKQMSRPAQFLLLKYCKSFPRNPRRGRELKRHMRFWVRKVMKAMDCGCGCSGMKKLVRLSGGKLKDCPPGYRNDGLTCLQECGADEEDIGLACKKRCPPGYRDDGVACRRCPPGYTDMGASCLAECKSGERDDGLFCNRPGCPSGYRDDGTMCRKCPPGYTDMGAHCHKPLRCNTWCDGSRDLFGNCYAWNLKTSCEGPHDTGQDTIARSYAKDSQQQEVIWREHRGKDIQGRVDWEATMEEIGQGFAEAFSADGPLARAFDPEKNGVAQAFREFGENTEKAFAKVGDALMNAFDPEKNGVKAAFEKLGETLSNTLGSADWWKETMTNPDTYIMLIGAIASAAATVLSAGTLGPVAFAALNMLGPSLKMIGDLAQGRPVDGLDIAAIAFAMVPMPGASAAANQLIGQVSQGVKYGTMAAKALPYAQKAVKMGELVVEGVKVAQGLGLVPSTCMANCPPPPPVVDPPSEEEMKQIQAELDAAFAGDDLAEAMNSVDLSDLDMGDLDMDTGELDLGDLDMGGEMDINLGEGELDMGDLGMDIGDSLIPADAVPEDEEVPLVEDTAPETQVDVGAFKAGLEAPVPTLSEDPVTLMDVPQQKVETAPTQEEAEPPMPTDMPNLQPGPLRQAFEQRYGVSADEVNAQVYKTRNANYAPLQPLAQNAPQRGNVDYVLEEMEAAVAEPLVGGRRRMSRKNTMSFQQRFDEASAANRHRIAQLQQRRAMVIQTRNKIKPVAMRPDLLNKVTRLRGGDILPQSSGGLEFYYPATSAREAGGVTSGGEVPGGFSAGLTGQGRTQMCF